jgi:hypothetical protein
VRRTWPAALALLLAGCGIQPTGVTDAGRAATGVAPGVTLYFVDADGRLQPQQRRTNRLGTISEALTFLLSGPGESGLRTEITPGPGPAAPVVVDPRPGLIRLMTPLADYEVTPRGIDQIVCTALGVWVQSGGSAATRVQVTFTLTSPESDRHRTCPLISRAG